MSDNFRREQWRWVYRRSGWSHIVEIESIPSEGDPVQTSKGPGLYWNGKGAVLTPDGEIAEAVVKYGFSKACLMARPDISRCFYLIDGVFCARAPYFFCEELRAILREKAIND